MQADAVGTCTSCPSQSCQDEESLVVGVADQGVAEVAGAAVPPPPGWELPAAGLLNRQEVPALHPAPVVVAGVEADVVVQQLFQEGS